MFQKLCRYLQWLPLLILPLAYQNCTPGFNSLEIEGEIASSSDEPLKTYLSVVFDVEKIQKDWGIEKVTDDSFRCVVANTELIPGEILYAPRQNSGAWRAPITDQVHRLIMMSDHQMPTTTGLAAIYRY